MVCCAPANHSIEIGACQNRLLKHQGHLVACIERPESPDEVKQTQALFVHKLSVGGIFQIVEQVDSEVPVCLDIFNISPINADRR